MGWWDQITGDIGKILNAPSSIWAYANRGNGVYHPKPAADAPQAQLPVTQEGAIVPIVYGRVRVGSPMLVWNSNLQTISSDNSNNGAAISVYGIDMLMKVGIPMGSGITTANKLASNAPRLYNVWYGDKKMVPPVTGCIPAIQGIRTLTGQLVWDTKALGGPGAGGGLVGTYAFYGGYTDQDISGEAVGLSMQTVLGGAISSDQIPGRRRVMCVAFTKQDQTGITVGINTASGDAGTAPETFDGVTEDIKTFMWGKSPNVQPVAIEVSAYGDLMWSMVNPGFDFGADADPAQVIYDMLTQKWGRGGIDPAKVDTSSFAACSATLASENHGYSIVLSSTTSVVSAISSVLAQIGGTLYVEPSTGLLTLKLIRFDYDPATIPAFTASDIIDVENYSLTGFSPDVINEVRVTYTDRLNDYKTGTAIAPVWGVYNSNNNRRRSHDVNYPGCTNATLAAKLAARDAQLLGQPSAKGTFTFDRKAFRLRPGAVFKATYPDIPALATATVFRVVNVDLNQLDDNKVVVDAIQDAFASTYGGSPLLYVKATSVAPYPLATRVITETPRWVAAQALHSGILVDPDIPHLMPLLAPSTNALTYSLQTKQRGIGPSDDAATIFKQFLVDIPQVAFPTTFLVNANYALELAPYDTTTGLVVNSVTGPLAATFATLAAAHDDIAQHGKNLIVVLGANGIDQEFMAFESVTDLGGGNYRLNHVWRGLLDTPPIAHVSGERGFMVESNMVGRRGWNIVKPISEWLIPAATNAVGSGGDPIDIYQTVARPVMPLSAADVGLAGDGVWGGVLGLPSIAGQYKSATWVEEAFDLYGYKRDRLRSVIARGDEGDDTLSDAGLFYSAAAFYTSLAHLSGWGSFPKGRASPSIGNASDNLITTGTNPSIAATGQALAGLGFFVNGYGAIDLVLLSSAGPIDLTVAAAIGGRSDSAFNPWQLARVPVVMPSWRNVLGNVRWNYGNGTNSLWTNAVGTSVVNSGTFSLSHAASGAGSYYLQPSAANLTERQTTFINNWIPRGLTAVLVGYIKNANADANDTGQLKLEAFSSLGVSLGSTTGTATVGPTANWSRLTISLVLPATTEHIQSSLISAEVATGGTTNADTCWAEGECRIGQFATTNGLANYSFDSGTTASWTVDAGGFTVVTGSSGPSPDYVQGGAFATSTIHQDYTLPTGHDYGDTAFLTIFMASVLANDTAKATIQARDGGGTVLATVTTNAQSFATLSVWKKFVINVALPDGTVTVRVILDATRTLGSGNSGAIFDEIVLWVSKDLQPRTSYSLDFSTPVVQSTPRTWQEHYLAYPSLPVPDVLVLNGNDFSGNEINWTDTGTHPTGKVCGQFGGGVGSINAYRFARASGAGAVHAAAFGPSRSTLAAFTAAQSFTVHVKGLSVDEFGFSTLCGIVGRMDLTAGWGLEINASGQPQALLRGASGSKTATVARSIADGSVHDVTLVYDAVGQTLTVYDEQGGGTPVSTASGLGEIYRTASTCHLRLGRDSDDHDVLPGQFGRVYIYSQALSSGQVAALSTLGHDPTGRITTYTRTATAVASGPNDFDGATASYMGTAQIAIPYNANLTVDSGTGYGLAVGKSAANLVPTWDVASWVAVGSPTLVRGGVDHTGRARGINVVAPSSADGIDITAIPLAATPATVMVTFWLRLTAGTNVDVHLRNSSLVNKSTVTITPTALNVWARYDLQLTGWDGSTVNGVIGFQGHSGETFDVGHTVCALQGTDFPALVPLPASTHGDYSATAAITLPVQFNSEGEVYAQGVSLVTAPTPATATLIQVKNGSNDKNRRELQMLATGTKFRFAHYDGAASPAATNADYAYAFATNVVWKARGRWGRAGMLDNNTPQPFSDVAVGDSTLSDPLNPAIVNGRVAAWTFDTTQSTSIKIGAGTAAPSDVLLRNVTVQTSSEKLT